MADLLIAGILVILVGIAVAYIIKEKKKGGKCIGCPSSGQCCSRAKGCGCQSKKA